MSGLNIFSEASKNFFTLMEKNDNVKFLLHSLDNKDKVSFGFGLGMKPSEIDQILFLIKSKEDVELEESTIQFNPIDFSSEKNKFKFKAYLLKNAGVNYFYLCYCPQLELAFYRVLERRTYAVFGGRFFEPYNVSDNLTLEHQIQGLSDPFKKPEEDLIFSFLKNFVKVKKLKEAEGMTGTPAFSFSYFMNTTELLDGFIWTKAQTIASYVILGSLHDGSTYKLVGFTINDKNYTF